MCHPHKNHIYLYSPASRHHCLFSWYSLRLPLKGWPDLSWPEWLVTYWDKCPTPGLNLYTITCTTTNRAHHRSTWLIETNTPPLRQTITLMMTMMVMLLLLLLMMMLMMMLMGCMWCRWWVLIILKTRNWRSVKLLRVCFVVFEF